MTNRMDDAGRMLLECLIGLFILSMMLGLVPEQSASVAKIAVIEELAETEARCIREALGSVLAHETKARVGKECEETVSIGCSSSSSDPKYCTIDLPKRPRIHSLEIKLQ